MYGKLLIYGSLDSVMSSTPAYLKMAKQRSINPGPS
jgi:hypothetical protein